MLPGTQHTEHVAVRASRGERSKSVGKPNHLRHAFHQGLFDHGGDGRELVRVHRIVREGSNHLTGEGRKRESTPKRVHEF